jgi:hypothetical protein
VAPDISKKGIAFILKRQVGHKVSTKVTRGFETSETLIQRCNHVPEDRNLQLSRYESIKILLHSYNFENRKLQMTLTGYILCTWELAGGRHSLSDSCLFIPEKYSSKYDA